jgi:aminoglycoside phosphotransferase (APT) family kinase protein
MLSTQQLQTALDRFQLGKLIAAEPVELGNFRQNVFLTSTAGAFVLRGAPLDALQFPTERWFMQRLHEQTQAPVPWPYLLDLGTDLFGWSYVIMPRLPGLPLADARVRERLTEQERRGIAGALGATLAEVHRLTWPAVGNYDLQSDTIRPMEGDYADRVLARLHGALAACVRATPRTTLADAAWVEEVIARGQFSLRAPFQPCCVHGDYQESNVVVEVKGDRWRVSGVFDMYPGFTDPETDLARPFAGYLDGRDPTLAREFLRAYSDQRPLRAGFAERFPLYMLQERMAMWEWAHREQKIWWDEWLTLRQWSEPFTTAHRLL